MTLEKILIFAGGALVGGIASWWCCKRHYERILDEYDEEILKLKGKDYYDEEDEDDEEDIPEEVPPKGEKVDYHSYYGKNDPAEKEHPREEEKKKDRKKPPEKITEEEFGEDGYKPVYLDYFNVDNVLVISDETEAKDLDEVRDWVGDALERFGFDENDEKRIIIRNHNRKCDYDVTKIWEAFNPADADE